MPAMKFIGLSPEGGSLDKVKIPKKVKAELTEILRKIQSKSISYVLITNPDVVKKFLYLRDLNLEDEDLSLLNEIITILRPFFMCENVAGINEEDAFPLINNSFYPHSSSYSPVIYPQQDKLEARKNYLLFCIVTDHYNVNLSKIKLTDDDLRLIAEIFTQNEHIIGHNKPHKYDLQNNKFKLEGIEYLAHLIALRKIPERSTLDLSNNDIGNDGIKKIIAALKSENATQGLIIYLRNCNIGNSGAEAIYDFYINFSSLYAFKIDFCNNEKIKQSTIEKFLYTEPPTVTEPRIVTGTIVFGNLALYQLPTKSFRCINTKNPNHTHVSYNSNKLIYTINYSNKCLNDGDVIAFVRLILRNKAGLQSIHFQTLIIDLSNNDITDVGVRALTEIFIAFNFLKTIRLRLNQNKLSQTAAEEILAVTQSNFLHTSCLDFKKNKRNRNGVKTQDLLFLKCDIICTNWPYEPRYSLDISSQFFSICFTIKEGSLRAFSLDLIEIILNYLDSTVAVNLVLFQEAYDKFMISLAPCLSRYAIWNLSQDSRFFGSKTKGTEQLISPTSLNDGYSLAQIF